MPYNGFYVSFAPRKRGSIPTLSTLQSRGYMLERISKRRIVNFKEIIDVAVMEKSIRITFRRRNSKYGPYYIEVPIDELLPYYKRAWVD